MRCRDAKLWLHAQRDSDLAQSDAPQFQEHLEQCPVCRMYQRHQQRLDQLFSTTPTPHTQADTSTISTARIMLAVQQQSKITQQLEDIRSQQRSRMLRWQTIGPALAAVAFFSLGILPLLLLALMIIQPDLMVQALMLLSSGIDLLVVLGQYVQTGLTLITHDNWILSGVAFVFVLMMGMWLRLMRYPQET